MSDASDAVSISLPEIRFSGTSTETDRGRMETPELLIEARQALIQPSLVADLRGLAREAAERAYAPYSNFRVGAAVVMSDDLESRIFTGCNVENASYGATICAERNAIFSAAGAGFRKIGFLFLTTLDSLGGEMADRSPCGSCRQVIREFADEKTLIFIDSGSDDVLGEVLDIDRLLPWGFVLDRS